MQKNELTASIARIIDVLNNELHFLTDANGVNNSNEEIRQNIIKVSSLIGQDPHSYPLYRTRVFFYDKPDGSTPQIIVRNCDNGTDTIYQFENPGENVSLHVDGSDFKIGDITVPNSTPLPRNIPIYRPGNQIQFDHYGDTKVTTNIELIGTDDDRDICGVDATTQKKQLHERYHLLLSNAPVHLKLIKKITKHYLQISYNTDYPYQLKIAGNR